MNLFALRTLEEIKIIHSFIHSIIIIYALRVSIFMTSPLEGGCWFVVFIRMFIYKILNICPFDYTAVARKPGKTHRMNGCCLLPFD